MKVEWFVRGLRVGVWFSTTMPYAFVAGLFYGVKLYGDAMLTNIENADRLKQWQDKLESSRYKPELKP